MEVNQREALRNLLNDELTLGTIRSVLETEARAYVGRANNAALTGNSNAAMAFNAKADMLYDVIDELEVALTTADQEAVAELEETEE
jgi:hypothetical protein